MLVLGIESSCDDTGIAVVRDGKEVLVSYVASQSDRLSEFGGVVPEIAAREHQKVISSLYLKAMHDAGLADRGAPFTIEDIDAIAVTQGPGLIGCLLVGTMFAKGLSLFSGKPLIPLNHVHGHIYGALLGLARDPDELFPCLTLVVSGGHTHLYLMEGHNKLKLLIHSIDDAVGECFDKVGKILGLPYPAGPYIEKEAKKGDPTVYPMPKMMKEKERLQYSYSGLKTHVVYLLEKLQKQSNGKGISDKQRADVCASFQEEAFGQLIRKISSLRAKNPNARKAKHLIVAGGVAANQKLASLLRNHLPLEIHLPPGKFCMDNGAMIAAYGYYTYSQTKKENSVSHNDWDAYSRYAYNEVL